MADTKSDGSALEEQRFDLDAEIRRREMVLKESEAKKKTGLTAAQATVAGAILALISGIAGAYINGQSTRTIENEKAVEARKTEDARLTSALELEKIRQNATLTLERKKFETTLIFEAIKTPSKADAAKNLKFFAAAGFIDDSNGKIANLRFEEAPWVAPDRKAPVLPASSPVLRQLLYTSNGQTSCTAIGMGPSAIITSPICVGDKESVVFHVSQTAFAARRGRPDLGAHLITLQTDQPLPFTNLRIRPPIDGEKIAVVGFKGSGNQVNAPQEPLLEMEYTEVEALAVDGRFRYRADISELAMGAAVIALSDHAVVGVHIGIETMSTTQSRPGLVTSLQATHGVAQQLPADFMMRR